MEQKKNTLNLLMMMMAAVLLLQTWGAFQEWRNPKPKPNPAEQVKEDEAAKPPAEGVPAEAAKAEPPKEQPNVADTPPHPTAPHKEIIFGDDKSYLGALLTSKGAGVCSLRLNKFEAAGKYGRPEHVPLELIPKDLNTDEPAFAVYLYEKPEDTRPLDVLGKLEWETKDESDPDNRKWQVTFSTQVPGRDLRISKTFTLKPDEYHIGLTVTIAPSKGTEKSRFRYQVASGRGLPIEGDWYTTIFRNAMVGAVVDKTNYFSREFQDSRYVGAHDGGDIVRRGEGHRLIYGAANVQYFSTVIAVDDEQENRNFLAWARPTLENGQHRDKLQFSDIAMRVVSDTIEVSPSDAPIVHKYVLYNGPVKVKLLGDRFEGSPGVSTELVNRYVDKLRLDTLTDYHMQGQGGPFVWISENVFCYGWTYLLISSTNFMHTVLDWLHSWVPNYGICIILLTFLVRGLLHPISRRQALSARRMQEKMKLLAPELKVLKEKNKDDFQALSRAQHELYRKHNVNPLAGMAGCLPLLAQMPIFMGLYYALQESIHFRLASFLWIKNLAAPDMMIWWTEKIPIISDPANRDSGLFSLLYLGPYFNLLPVIAAGLMLVQQKLMMPPPVDEQAEMQQKMTKYMTVFFALMFYKMAAGLCLYFIVSSTWGLIERKMLPKKKEDGPDDVKQVANLNGANGKTARTGKIAKKKQDKDPSLQNKAKELWAELLKQARKK
jgi:YidC/Oxa1 family membrane protein insertase